MTLLIHLDSDDVSVLKNSASSSENIHVDGLDTIVKSIYTVRPTYILERPGLYWLSQYEGATRTIFYVRIVNASHHCFIIAYKTERIFFHSRF